MIIGKEKKKYFGIWPLPSEEQFLFSRSYCSCEKKVEEEEEEEGAIEERPLCI
jgi:hypothetical protein